MAEAAYPIQDLAGISDTIPRRVTTGVAENTPNVLTRIIPVLPPGWQVLLEVNLYVAGDWFFRLDDDNGVEVPGPRNQWISIPGTNNHRILMARSAAAPININYIILGK